MKTSVVLLALATAALAAPALHEETFEDVHHIPAKFLDAFTRERKSTPESGSNPSPGSPVNLPSSQVSEFGVSGRSFNLKKPIIIQKKIGSRYQVYRDSDEEKLDSPVPCRKQVRVNLCDEQSVVKSADMMRNSAVEDLNQPMTTTEDDMKHSIKLAKEAVENLQKSTNWKHGESKSDAELHQDIEQARQALEHIQNNFEDLEAPNTHTTLKDAEIVGDVAFPLEKTEEERLAQWKDAIENIHRNVELVRNIEESFKSAHDGMPHNEETATKDFNIHEHAAKNDLRVTGNVEMKKHEPTMEELQHSKREKLSEHEEMKTDVTQKDMLESASMVSSSKLQNLHHNGHAKDANEKLHHGKDAVDTTTLDNFSQNMDINTLALKVAEEVKEGKTETDLTEKNHGLKESVLKNQRDANKEHHNAHMTFKHDEKPKQFGEHEAKMIEMKSAEQITDKHNKLIKDEDKTEGGHHAMEQMKQAGGFGTVGNKQDNKQFLVEMKTHENMVHKDLIEGKAALQENSPMTSDSLAIDQHKAMMEHPDLKSAEDSKNMQQQFDHSHMRWAQDKRFNNEMELLKSAAETHQDHLHKMHDGHHHTHQHANPHDFNAPNHGHMRQSEHFMTHGKSADMDNPMQPNYFMNMRDSENMGQNGQRFKWRPANTHHHESARTAYGAPIASLPASGAVGLFPNANVGSCGIPLLLSCNPSVVSGSLAKAHPAPYAAPAYRTGTEDDFNFHSKRDVMKTEKLGSTLNKAPNNTIFKTNSVLAAKH